MTGHVGYGIMSRVRPTCSHQNLRTTWASEQAEHHKFTIRPQRNKSVSSVTPSVSSSTHHSRQRNHSVSHTTPSPPPRKMQDGHWPPLEFDPLKLNPTVVEVAATAEKPPPRLYERDLLRTRSLRTKPSQREAVTPRSRPRLHHSDSGISFDYDAYSSGQQFDFAEEKAKALQDLQQQHATHNLKADQKGWPSPASSVDSGKSWFDLDDDSSDEDAYDDDDSSVTDESEVEELEDKEVWTELSSPRRRPQVGSPDDPTNYLKRGAWKRRAIFFGQQSNEVYTKEEDAFDIL